MENKFNLEKAMAGKPVQTRDGRAVTQLKFFEDVNLNLIVGVVSKNIWSWDINGQLDSLRGDSDKDLFMAPEKKSVWVNVYESEDNTDEFQVYTSRLHPTKESALAHRKDYNYIKTIEITNEP